MLRRPRVPEPDQPAVDADLAALAAEEAGGLRFVPGRFEWLRIDDLEPDPRNPNEADVGALATSIDALGFYGVLYVQEAHRSPTGKYRLIAGEHRWRDLCRRGAPSAPCWIMDCDHDDAIRMLITDNRQPRLGRDRPDAMADLLRELRESERGLAGTGWDGDDLEALLRDLDEPLAFPPPAPEPAPAPPAARAEPITQRGDLWDVAGHRLLCGDSRDDADVVRLLGTDEVNVAFTSPPYAEQREYDEDSGFVPIPPDEFVEWFAPVAANVRDHLAEDGSWFVNIKPGTDELDTDLYVFDLVVAHVREWGWHFATEFCWERVGIPRQVSRRFKNEFEPVYQFARAPWKMRPDAVREKAVQPASTYPVGHPDQWQGLGVDGARRAQENELAYPGNRLPTFSGSHEALGHEAAFPVGLPAWFLRAYSDPGDVVYDPFAGSGSTIVAAHQEGRLGRGIELSRGYCDIALERLQRATGVLPSLVATGETRDFTQQ